MANYNLKNKVACVYDYGSFLPIALRIAKDFKKVYYVTHWQSGFPTSLCNQKGKGFEEIEVVDNIWKVLNEVDIFIFPDLYDADLQYHLVDMGKLVWGARGGEELEINRLQAHKYFKKLGLPTGEIEKVIGTEKLRELFKEKDNLWLKVSKYRGDFETFHHVSYEATDAWLTKLEHSIGALKYIYEFLVFHPLDNKVEIGFDGYCVDGKFPNKGICGIEVKDLGYVSKFMDYKDMAKEITGFNTTISDTLKNYGYRGFYSTELRVGKDKVPYMIDLCCRSGCPPSELYQELYTNFSEIIWAGANGEIIDPIPAAKFGVEIMVYSQWADKNWQSIKFPEKIKQYIKIKDATKIKGKYYTIPQEYDSTEIAAVLGMGNTLEEAIEMAKDNASQIKGYDIEIHQESMDAANEQLALCKEYGIKLF